MVAELSDTPESSEQEARIACTSRLSSKIWLAAVAILLLVAVFEAPRWRDELKRECRARWIADMKARKTNCLSHPDPMLLDDLAQDAECAERLTEVQLGEMYPPNYPKNRYTALKKLPHLQTIFVSYTIGADAFLDDIKGMTSLEELSFYHARVSAFGARHLASLPNLKRLHLYDRAEPALDVLKNDVRIAELSFGGQITPARVALLKTLPNLRFLRLRVELEDRGSLDLRGLGKLEMLGLGGDGVTDATLAGLERMPDLTTLILNESMITDAALGHLTELTALQKLDLHETRVSDNGLKHLTGLAKLRKLDLRNTRATDRGVRELQQSLPNCKIDR